MNVLAVGLSHRTAGVRELERASIAPADLAKVLEELALGADITEAMVLSTCNRVEIYAVVETFHGGVVALTEVLSGRAGLEAGEISPGLFVHYSAAAVEHLFSVAAGLDSMAVGETQILGQLRTAYAAADRAGTVGRILHELVQYALRVGKRVHTETDIDHVAASVVGVALAEAEIALGGLAGRRALVIGAGAMGSLASVALRRAGIGQVVIANRTPANGARLAAALAEEGVAAEADGLADLAGHLAAADVVVACTGATDVVVPADLVATGLIGRDPARPLVICDLGLPRDVGAEAADLPGVRLLDLDALGRVLATAPAGQHTGRAGEILAEELRGYLAAQRSAAVTPTVTALRRRAAEVVDAELLRLAGRLPELDDDVRAELDKTVRRVVDKLLHTPTVRVKQLAAEPAGAGYADALRELFQLDPQAAAAVSASVAGQDLPGQDLAGQAPVGQARVRQELGGDRKLPDGENC